MVNSASECVHWQRSLYCRTRKATTALPAAKVHLKAGFLDEIRGVVVNGDMEDAA